MIDDLVRRPVVSLLWNLAPAAIFAPIFYWVFAIIDHWRREAQKP